MDSRPYVISISGFDPSAGAGVLTDVKCFEQHQVYGFGICSALTVQTADAFISSKWLDAKEIIGQLEPLFSKFKISACKIGLIRDIGVLSAVIGFIRSLDKRISIVLDPVLKTSSGFEFHQWDAVLLDPILKDIDLITPNYHEMISMGKGENPEKTAALWTVCCPVLLKGGHRLSAPGTDLLFAGTEIFGHVEIFEFKPQSTSVHQKHGSGCVLSAAVTANLALGYGLKEACRIGKIYTEGFLNSNSTLLGYHNYDR